MFGWKEDIMLALQLLDASLKGTGPSDEMKDTLDFITIFYGKLNSFYCDSPKFRGKVYNDYIVHMKNFLETAFNE